MPLSFFFSLVFRAEPAAYRSSQARGRIVAAAAGLHQILNPLREARNQTRVLMDTSQVPNPLSHNRNPLSSFVKQLKVYFHVFTTIFNFFP